MIAVAYALIIISAFACAAWLIVNGHPWFAAWVLIVASCISITRTTTK